MRPFVLFVVTAMLASCAGSSPRIRDAAGVSREISRTWVLVTVQSARISEQVDGGTTWDPDIAAARREHEQESTSALIGLLGLVNPAAGTILGALAALSSPAPQAEADPTHPDPQLEIVWRDGLQPYRFVSARLPDTVRPVWDYAMLVHVRADSTEDLRIRVRDVDGPNQDAPLIGETTIPITELAGVVASGRAATWNRANHELHEIVVRAQPVPREGVLFQTTVDLALQQGVLPVGEAVPAGVIVRAYAAGEGSIGGGYACPAAVGPLGRPGDQCRGYNLGVPSLREAPHGGAVILLGPGSVVGVPLVATDVLDPMGPACVEFSAPSFGQPVVGVNDREFGNNRGSFVFAVKYSVPADDFAFDGTSLAMPCSEFTNAEPANDERRAGD